MHIRLVAVVLALELPTCLTGRVFHQDAAAAHPDVAISEGRLYAEPEARLVKRAPGNCLGKLCQAQTPDPNLGSRDNHHPDAQPDPTIHGRLDLLNQMDRPFSPTGRSSARSSDPGPPSRSRASTVRAPESQQHSILSLTSTLPHIASMSYLRSQSTGSPSRMQNHGLGAVRVHYVDARSGRRRSGVSGTSSAPHTSDGSIHGRPPRHHRADGAGPSSEPHTLSSEPAHDAMTPEDEMRLHTLVTNWSHMMSSAAPHVWSPRAAHTFRNMVHEHVEPFRYGDVTPQKIAILHDRNENNIKDLLATEVAKHHVARTFPEQAGHLAGGSGAALTMASTHDELVNFQ